MFDSHRFVARGSGELADLNDIGVVVRAADPPVYCTVPTRELLPARTVGWGQSVALWIRASALDPDGRSTAALLDEGITTQGLHVARVAATLATPKRKPLWDVIAVVPFAVVEDLPDGYRPLI